MPQAVSAETLNGCGGVPRCGCGGVIRPDIVLYEERLDEDVMDRSLRAIASADVLIIGGTSLGVYPAAGLINYYRGNKMVLINMTATPYDDAADLVIRAKIGEVFSKV
jgi:NAD-dependent deacetylase